MFFIRPMKAWRLLNHVPFDGCLLVFNGNQSDFRSKAADFKKKHGFAFRVHAINSSGGRNGAHDRTIKTDLYITIKQ